MSFGLLILAGILPWVFLADHAFGKDDDEDQADLSTDVTDPTEPIYPTDETDPTDVTDVTLAINGTSGEDSLFGTQDDDRLNGLGGDDALLGSWGHDSLEGGAGNDTLDGGTGTQTSSQISTWKVMGTLPVERNRKSVPKGTFWPASVISGSSTLAPEMKCRFS